MPGVAASAPTERASLRGAQGCVWRETLPVNTAHTPPRPALASSGTCLCALVCHRPVAGGAQSLTPEHHSTTSRYLTSLLTICTARVTRCCPQVEEESDMGGAVRGLVALHEGVVEYLKAQVGVGCGCGCGCGCRCWFGCRAGSCL